MENNVIKQFENETNNRPIQLDRIVKRYTTDMDYYRLHSSLNKGGYNYTLNNYILTVGDYSWDLKEEITKQKEEITKQKEEKQLLNNLKNIYNHWLTTDCDNLYKKDWEKMFCMYHQILNNKRDDEYNDEILLIIYKQIIEK